MKIKDIALMTVCLSILIISSKISISIGVIAITLQTFAVALIPYILKWKRSAIVFIAYIIMGLIGIPVFSAGGGIYYILKPSFGFILGFLASCFITGTNYLNDKKIANLFKGLIGLVVLDIIGLVYMYFIMKYYMNNNTVTIIYILEIGFLPFIIKDIISVILAWGISLRLQVVIDNMSSFNNSLIQE